MQLCYVHESENASHHALAALGVDVSVWPDLSARFGRWHTALLVRHRIPLGQDVRARDLLAGGRGWAASPTRPAVSPWSRAPRSSWTA